MKSIEQQEREVLNTLATMPEHSEAMILGVRVGRVLFGYYVEGGDPMHPRGAAKKIVRLANERNRDPNSDLH